MSPWFVFFGHRSAGMNVGLIRRSLRETGPTTVAFCAAVMLFAALLNYALPKFQQGFSSSGRRVPTMLAKVRSAMLGMETQGMTSLEIGTAIAWSHPVILALLFAHAIIYCTRVPAGEIERGTIDVLLGLPVSRWQVWTSETAAWLLSAAAVFACAVVGSRIGNRYIDPKIRPELDSVLMIQVNLLGMYAAVGALALLAASMMDRRGRAVLVALIAVLGSFMVNYLSLLWDDAKRLNFLSLLHYFRPVVMLRDQAWPVRDLAVLFAAAAGMWLAGGVVMARRDMSTT